MGRGRFIVFEGGEGSGKSTQAARLAAELGALLTREPGGTGLGRAIRQLVLGPGQPAAVAEGDGPAMLDARAEALLLAADRAQHVAQVIRPALAAGRDVVSDRYAGSSVAYQGYARGLGSDAIRDLSRWASDGLEPDLVILLEVPAGVAAARLGATGVAPDRLEAAGEEFHRRVAEGFRAQARAGPGVWRVIDGDGSADVVADRILSQVRDFFHRPHP